MRLDLSEPRFKQAAACEITGLRPAAIQTRVNRGQVKLAQQHPGRQAKRLFSALDLIKLYFIEQMSRHKFSSGVASEIAEEVAGHALRWWKTCPEKTVPFLGTESDRVVDDLPAIYIEMSEEGWRERWRLAVFVGADGHVETLPFKVSIEKDYFFDVASIFPEIYTVIQVDVLISIIINKILRFIYEEKGGRVT